MTLPVDFRQELRLLWALRIPDDFGDPKFRGRTSAERFLDSWMNRESQTISAIRPSRGKPSPSDFGARHGIRIPEFRGSPGIGGATFAGAISELVMASSPEDFRGGEGPWGATLGSSMFLRLLKAFQSAEDSGDPNFHGTSLVGAVSRLLDELRTPDDFGHANFRGADLSGATLGTGFRSADFRGANLSGARLMQADLSGAKFNFADLHDADLREANFHMTDLSEADLSGTTMGWTVFADTNLRGAKGLESCKHQGPSSIGIDTFFLSKGEIPEGFLRGCGVPERFTARYRELTVTLSPARRRQSRGIRCWLDQHQSGDDI